MTPITQTKFGRPDGNCFAACVASILEARLEELDSVEAAHADYARRYIDAGDEDPGGPHWWDALVAWSRSHGYQPLYLPEKELAPAGYAIASGPGPRGLPHAVVTLHGNVVHDPHPDRAGITEFIDFTVFVPLVAPGRTAP